MNYSETINDLFDPLEGLTKSEALDYLDDNEESIKDEIFAAIILFLGVSKPIYKKTSITIFNETKRIIRREFKSLDEKKLLKQKVKRVKFYQIESSMLAKVKMRNQYLLTNAKEINQQVIKQDHFIEKAKVTQNKNIEVIKNKPGYVKNQTDLQVGHVVLWYVLNEKTKNHCPYCVENNKGKIYSIDNAPELPNKEGHGEVGYGCYCYYIIVRDKAHLQALIDKENSREFIKNWWTDPDVAPLFLDDKTNKELPN